MPSSLRSKLSTEPSAGVREGPPAGLRPGGASARPRRSTGEAAPVLADLERRLGHAFADPRLLRRALTHGSGGADNYERLEFLGDAALGFIVARLVFDHAPNATEQRLTLIRSHLVNDEALAEIARELAIGAHLVLGHGERRTGGAERRSILAAAIEAVIGAVVCDGGVDAATGVVRRLFAKRLAATGETELKDPKTRLQERAQERGWALPCYEIVSATGPEHAPAYTAECHLEAVGVRARGVGGNRREAEKNAAALALEKLGPAKSEVMKAAETTPATPGSRPA